MGVVLCAYVVSDVVKCGWMEAGRQGKGRQAGTDGVE